MGRPKENYLYHDLAGGQVSSPKNRRNTGRMSALRVFGGRLASVMFIVEQSVSGTCSCEDRGLEVGVTGSREKWRDNWPAPQLTPSGPRVPPGVIHTPNFLLNSYAAVNCICLWNHSSLSYVLDHPHGYKPQSQYHTSFSSLDRYLTQMFNADVAFTLWKDCFANDLKLLSSNISDGQTQLP
jgi:hypothetical protein